MDGFPSGQRGQTVNLLQIASVVRIHLHPLERIEKGVTDWSHPFYVNLDIWLRKYRGSLIGNLHQTEIYRAVFLSFTN